MIRIVIGGQMDKQMIEKLVQVNNNGAIDVSIKNDLEAAMAVQMDQADYYLGSCATGAGASLAMAIALIGADYCVSLSIPGRVMSEDEIKNEVLSGKKAFGFVNTDAERIVPTLLKCLLEK